MAAIIDATAECGRPPPGRRDGPSPPLLHGRVGGGAEHLRGQAGHEWSVLLRLGELGETLLVGDEGVPLLLAVGEAVVGQDVDELVRRAAELVGPESDHLDTVLLEIAHGDVGEAAVEVGQASRDGVIGPHLVQHGVGLLVGGVVGPGPTNSSPFPRSGSTRRRFCPETCGTSAMAARRARPASAATAAPWIVSPSARTFWWTFARSTCAPRSWECRCPGPWPSRPWEASCSSIPRAIARWRAAPPRATRSCSSRAPRAGRWRTWPRPARGPRCSSSITTAIARGPPIFSRAWRPRATSRSFSPWTCRSTADASATSSIVTARANP